MGKRLIGVLTIIGLGLILTACGTSESSTVSNSSKQNHISPQNNKDSGKLNKGKNSNKQSSTSKKPSNQSNLGLGDTGVIKSNINYYKITPESIRITPKEINGSKPLSDQFIVMNVSVKNIGKNDMKAEDVAQVLTLTQNLKGSGMPDDAGLIGGVKTLKGTIKPGETVTGQLIFDVQKVSKYYLVDGASLADQGAGLQNKVIWTFNASQAK